MGVQLTQAATGLSDRILSDLDKTFRRFDEVEQVWLYGSRARGDYTPGSDIDLVVIAPKMTSTHFAQLFDAIEALPIAFKTDVVHWDSLSNADLKQNIIADHRVFWSKS